MAKANLLNNRKATTHWLFTNLFKDMFPQVQLHSEIKVTSDNNIFCTSGTYEYNDVMMHIIEQIYGQNTREACSQLIFGDIKGAPTYSGKFCTIPPAFRHINPQTTGLDAFYHPIRHIIGQRFGR
ncbi:hypothetical protein [Photorhabdus temperata]|uniref:hypothetical protein n=1 Tax=Photorhabdus temperata TaxID=574560 RepID=UPI001FB0ED37|nr:hypothetical protein [Photorhabdus temperata]